MKKLSKHILSKISVGDIITLRIAHRYRKDYGWDSYTDTKYKVTNVGKYSIKGFDVNDESNGVIIDRSSLDDLRFVLDI